MDAYLGSDVPFRVEGQQANLAPDPAQVNQVVPTNPRFVVVGDHHHLGIHGGHDLGQGGWHLPLPVERAPRGAVAHVNSLAGHSVVLRGVPRHQGLPHVVVGHVPVLVVWGV